MGKLASRLDAAIDAIGARVRPAYLLHVYVGDDDDCRLCGEGIGADVHIGTEHRGKYGCDRCTALFPTEKAAEKHRDTCPRFTYDHGPTGAVYECEVCGAKFPVNDALSRFWDHLQEH